MLNHGFCCCKIETNKGIKKNNNPDCVQEKREEIGRYGREHKGDIGIWRLRTERERERELEREWIMDGDSESKYM